MTHLFTPAFLKRVPDDYAASLALLDDVALEAVLIRIIEILPEDKLPEFEATLSLSDSRALDAFIHNEVPDARRLMKGVITELEKEMADLIDTLES